MLEHTPKDEELTLKLGNAFDLVAEESLTDSKRITDKMNETFITINSKIRKNKMWKSR